MPKLLQWISYVIPIRYYLVIIRSLLIKGVGVSSLQNEILALLLFAIVIMTLAILRFRKRLDWDRRMRRLKMHKRIAKKILKNKDKLNYKPSQIAEVEEKFQKTTDKKAVKKKS